MQVVHELGHVLGAVCTGAEINRLVLHPLSLSRTELASNPSPLVVVWLGPLLGVLLPLALWAGVRLVSESWAPFLRFFAGFCLIANGVYIAFGPADLVSDTGQMLAHGTPRWLMLVFGVSSLAAGLGLWNGQGRHFGMEGQAVEGKRALLVFFGLCLLVVVELII